MKKKFIIAASIFAGLLTVLYTVYLFLVPNFIDLNSYKQEMAKAVKDATGLDLSIGDVNFKTNPDFSVTIFAKKALVRHEDEKQLLSVDNAHVKVSLLPLIFKNIEIKDVAINNIYVNFYRLKDGTYKIQETLDKLKPSDKKQGFKLVKGVDIEINNYKLQLDDYFYTNPQKFLLTGDLVKISDFNPEKFIKLETKGKFLIQDKPNVNFDVRFTSELPLTDKKEQKTSQSFDILENIKKYDFKSNLVVDLAIKDVDKAPDINGFIKLDNFSLNIKGKTLPSSYGKVDFKGKTFDVDSKLYITPVSYIDIAGNIEDLSRNKLDLSLKTTDIDLKDLKCFIDALNEVSGMKNDAIASSNISGKLKADFKINNNTGVPDFSGYFNVSNAAVSYNGISKPLKNINSNINFQGKNIVLNDTYGYIDDNKINLTGNINYENYADLKLFVDKFNLKTVYDLANQSSLFATAKPQLKEISSLAGNIKIESAIKGKLNRIIFPETKISVINPSVVPKSLGLPINFIKGIIFVNENEILINGLQASALNSPVFISGNVTDYLAEKPKPDVTIKIPELRLANIKSLSKLPITDKETVKLINNIKNLSGTIATNIKINQEQKINADASINAVSFYYTPCSLPVSISNGSLNADGKVLNVKNIDFKLSNSPIKISGLVSDLEKVPVLDLAISGRISAADIKKYSSLDLRKSVKFRGDLPLNGLVSGTVNNWNITAQTLIDNLSYFADITNPGKKLLNLNVQGNSGSLIFNNSGLYTINGAPNSNFYNINSAGKLISINGEINKLNTQKPVLNNTKIALSNLNLSLVEPKGTLQLNGNISLSGNVSNPKALGTLTVKNLSVPSMALSSSGINLSMKNNGIFLSTALLKVIDSGFKIDMALKNDLSSPFVIENINVSSSYVNADKLQKAFPPVPNQDLPVIVRKGKFYVKEMLINGIRTGDTSLDFVINPMNIMKMTDLTTSAVGGTASGKIDMNLKTSKISVDIVTKNMEVNELATTFANKRGEIYGKMNGRISLTTQGYTPEQTANNAYGKIVFTVNDGKLNKLGSLSNLLRAGNILSQGVGTQVIDNILVSKEAKASNQFKKITGDISLSNGIMNINEITAQGVDMSLYTKGVMRISNNYSEMLVLGTLSDRISSRLGKLTELSADTLINKIPGQWGQVIGSLRQKPQYPDIEKIPPLAGGENGTEKHFAAKIEGDLQSPRSVKSFKFIN